jgi:hypothetical protein
MTGWEDEDAVEEVLAAKILVGHPITEDVARADEDRVSDGSDSAPVAPATLDPDVRALRDDELG